MLHERISQYVCPVCGFDLWRPLARLSVSTLGFYDDDRFPGRCLLALNVHYDDLADVETETLNSFMADVQRAARAIKVATTADRINYAVLGNMLSHVHFHLIPRVSDGDPIPTRPPWEHPLPASPLPTTEAERISEAIIAALKLTV